MKKDIFYCADNMPVYCFEIWKNTPNGPLLYKLYHSIEDFTFRELICAIFRKVWKRLRFNRSKKYNYASSILQEELKAIYK